MIAFLLLTALCASPAQDPPSSTAPDSAISRVDASTLQGKIMNGYQGWFTTPDDGMGLGWHHWRQGAEFKPGSCCVDMWPDVSELPPASRVDTPFRFADGSVAQVFSSADPAVVDMHFRWMQEYGLDGVFVQRFATETMRPAVRKFRDRVLQNCRESANRHGRVYALMYDLSGLQAGQTAKVIEDWKRLVDQKQVGRDASDRSYLHHAGKPVVAVWGIGFNEGRKYTLAECRELIRFLKEDPVYGGNTVMIGVPTAWRTGTRDALDDPLLLEIAALADIISPWSVGRIRGLSTVEDFAQTWWKPDLAWCRERDKLYLPVVYPGFSWHNKRPAWPFDEIPREDGKFLWQQYSELQGMGATMVYQAMFDEVDEATAIFKCNPNPPVGESRFLSSDSLPSDHYLWLLGQAGRLLHGELKTPVFPKRAKE
jgi:hypothetical protein